MKFLAKINLDPKDEPAAKRQNRHACARTGGALADRNRPLEGPRGTVHDCTHRAPSTAFREAKRVLSKFRIGVNPVYDRVCLKFSSFVLNHPKGYMALTAFLGAASLIILLAPDAGAQLEQQVTEALNPLARLLVGPIAKGLAVIGLFSFVGFLYAGKWLIAISSLVAAVILALLANIITAIFQGSTAGSFTLGP